MTPEEKAEEYATKETNKYYGACFKTEVYKFGNCKHECLVKWEASKQSYLDGYEQGYEDCRHYAHDYYKPKWHDLRVNPNDLPKLEDKRIPWSITVANQLGEACHYNYRKLRWETPLATKIEEVIKWCELPKF